MYTQLDIKSCSVGSKHTNDAPVLSCIMRGRHVATFTAFTHHTEWQEVLLEHWRKKKLSSRTCVGTTEYQLRGGHTQQLSAPARARAIRWSCRMIGGLITPRSSVISHNSAQLTAPGSDIQRAADTGAKLRLSSSTTWFHSAPPLHPHTWVTWVNAGTPSY